MLVALLLLLLLLLLELFLELAEGFEVEFGGFEVVFGLASLWVVVEGVLEGVDGESGVLDGLFEVFGGVAGVVVVLRFGELVCGFGDGESRVEDEGGVGLRLCLCELESALEGGEGVGQAVLSEVGDGAVEVGVGVVGGDGEGLFEELVGLLGLVL